MAQFYAVNAADNENTVPVVKIPVGEGGGRLRVMFDSWVLPATAPGANDLVDFCAPLPPNARLLDVVLVFPAWANSATFSMGWKANETDAANATGITSALAVTSAGVYRSLITDPTNMNKKFNVGSTAAYIPTQLQGKVGTAPTNTTGTNYWQVYFLTD